MLNKTEEYLKQFANYESNPSIYSKEINDMMNNILSDVNLILADEILTKEDKVSILKSYNKLYYRITYAADQAEAVENMEVATGDFIFDNDDVLMRALENKSM